MVGAWMGVRRGAGAQWLGGEGKGGGSTEGHGGTRRRAEGGEFGRGRGELQRKAGEGEAGGRMLRWGSAEEGAQKERPYRECAEEAGRRQVTDVEERGQGPGRLRAGKGVVLWGMGRLLDAGWAEG